TTLLPLLYISTAFAAPGRDHDVQAVLSESAALVDTVHEGLPYGNVPGSDKVETWSEEGSEFLKQNGLSVTFLVELVKHSAFPNHQLRIREPDLCDPSVQQYSGYLDVTEGKHLFFGSFFESRSNPSKDPLVLWLNGGPGCSSSTGLLFELGPCLIADKGRNTTFNPHSWNEPDCCLDVTQFLELFITRFHKYARLPFHLAAESYGGTFAPNIASVIYKKNKELAAAPSPKLAKIILASVILANGFTDPYIQMTSVPDYACDGPYPVYDAEGPQCVALRTKVPICQRLIKSCYAFNSRLTCVPAALYCWGQLMGPLQQIGLNIYDVRKKCDRSEDADGPICYKEIGWTETWLNNPKTKAALGADPSRTFGDDMHNPPLLPELINDGIRLLVYAATPGNEAWVENLEHKFHKEFKAAPPIQWVIERSGRVAGEVRTAGGGGTGAGNVTFVNVYEAGSAALDMFTRWIFDASLTLN
ncbi:carboxypeptidase C, partial [Lactarius hengduanensis]